VIPFRTKPGTYYSATSKPGYVIAHEGGYLMFFSASTADPIRRTLGIARPRTSTVPGSSMPSRSFRRPSRSRTRQWSRHIIGRPSVVQVGGRLAIFYDGNAAGQMPTGVKSHMNATWAWRGWTCRWWRSAGR